MSLMKGIFILQLNICFQYLVVNNDLDISRTEDNVDVITDILSTFKFEITVL